MKHFLHAAGIPLRIHSIWKYSATSKNLQLFLDTYLSQDLLFHNQENLWFKIFDEFTKMLLGRDLIWSSFPDTTMSQFFTFPSFQKWQLMYFHPCMYLSYMYLCVRSLRCNMPVIYLCILYICMLCRIQEGSVVWGSNVLLLRL